MSKRKIVAALKRKCIVAERIEYMRACPTPYGYANGWDVELTQAVSEELYNRGFDRGDYYEFDTLAEVLEWIEDMPSLYV